MALSNSGDLSNQFAQRALFHVDGAITHAEPRSAALDVSPSRLSISSSPSDEPGLKAETLDFS